MARGRKLTRRAKRGTRKGSRKGTRRQRGGQNAMAPAAAPTVAPAAPMAAPTVAPAAAATETVNVYLFKPGGLPASSTPALRPGSRASTPAATSSNILFKGSDNTNITANGGTAQGINIDLSKMTNKKLINWNVQYSKNGTFIDATKQDIPGNAGYANMKSGTSFVRKMGVNPSGTQIGLPAKVPITTINATGLETVGTSATRVTNVNSKYQGNIRIVLTFA